jgi:hypothetical protein
MHAFFWTLIGAQYKVCWAPERTRWHKGLEMKVGIPALESSKHLD